MVFRFFLGFSILLLGVLVDGILGDDDLTKRLIALDVLVLPDRQYLVPRLLNPLAWL